MDKTICVIGRLHWATNSQHVCNAWLRGDGLRGIVRKRGTMQPSKKFALGTSITFLAAVVALPPGFTIIITLLGR